MGKDVTIEEQVWMAKNLNVVKFRNGDSIPEAKTDEEWEKAGDNGQPVWCYYNNDPLNGEKFGKLYNWYAVNDTRGLAPVGWKIPSDKDWKILTDYLGGEEIAGTKMKSKSGWKEDGNRTNESCFSATPLGMRFHLGMFSNDSAYATWWTSTEDEAAIAVGRRILHSLGSVIRITLPKEYGISVRYLKV